MSFKENIVASRLLNDISSRNSPFRIVKNFHNGQVREGVFVSRVGLENLQKVLAANPANEFAMQLMEKLLLRP